jgi:hypothetical protein
VDDADDVERAAGDHAGQAAPQAVAHVVVGGGGGARFRRDEIASLACIIGRCLFVMGVATGKGVYIARQVELLGMPAQGITILVARATLTPNTV